MELDYGRLSLESSPVQTQQGPSIHSPCAQWVGSVQQASHIKSAFEARRRASRSNATPVKDT